MNITRTNTTVMDDAFLKTRKYMDVKTEENEAKTFKGWSVTDKEFEIIHGFLDNHSDGEKTVSTLLMKNIEITSKNLEGVHAALQGTTPKDARIISKIMRSSPGSHLANTIKDIMSKSLAKSTLALMKQHTFTQTTTYTHSVYMERSYSQSGRYYREVYSEFVQYKETYTGKYVDESMQPALDEHLNGGTSEPLFQCITERFRERFDDLMASLDDDDFDILTYETIVLADGVLTTEEQYQLSQLPYKLHEAQATYKETIDEIKDLAENGTTVGSLESIAEKLHDVLLNDDFVDYLNEDALQQLIDVKHQVDQLLSDGDMEALEAFRETIKNLEASELSKSRLIQSVFGDPYEDITSNMSDTHKAKRILKLIQYADVHVAFDKLFSEPTLVWKNLLGKNPPAISSKYKSTTQIMTKKRYGRDLLNNATSQMSVRQYFMSMLGYDNQVLDIQFLQRDRLLDFSNFSLSVDVHYKAHGLANYQLDVKDHHLYFKMHSKSMYLIEQVQSQETYITESAQTMGFKGVSYKYSQANYLVSHNDENGRCYSLHLESAHSFQATEFQLGVNYETVSRE